eukprot:2466953-Pyramimonas_sp.AAC.1
MVATGDARDSQRLKRVLLGVVRASESTVHHPRTASSARAERPDLARAGNGRKPRCVEPTATPAPPGKTRRVQKAPEQCE